MIRARFFLKSLVSEAADECILAVLSADDAQGTVTGGGSYTIGEVVHVETTPKAGYAFDVWSDGDHNDSRDITVSQGLTLVAAFKVVTAGSGTGSNETHPSTGGGLGD